MSTPKHNVLKRVIEACEAKDFTKLAAWWCFLTSNHLGQGSVMYASLSYMGLEGYSPGLHVVNYVLEDDELEFFSKLDEDNPDPELFEVYCDEDQEEHKPDTRSWRGF